MTQPIIGTLVMLDPSRQEAGSKSRFFLPISAIIPARESGLESRSATLVSVAKFGHFELTDPSEELKKLGAKRK